MPAEDQVARKAARLLDRWQEAGEEKADAHDVAVQRAIEDAIRLQESDPEPDAVDKQVLSLLKQALAAQRQDVG